tara:strand:- start:610 stop:813 length:204 start_codon:yes stop_codon:yes gene_type:complete
MSKLKLKGNVELFDIAFGLFIGYCSFKGTNNWVASIIVGIIMTFAMSSFKVSFKKDVEKGREEAYKD